MEIRICVSFLYFTASTLFVHNFTNNGLNLTVVIDLKRSLQELFNDTSIKLVLQKIMKLQKDEVTRNRELRAIISPKK